MLTVFRQVSTAIQDLDTSEINIEVRICEDTKVSLSEITMSATYICGERSRYELCAGDKVLPFFETFMQCLTIFGPSTMLVSVPKILLATTFWKLLFSEEVKIFNTNCSKGF